MFYVPDRVLETVLEEDLPYGDETTSLLEIRDFRGSIVAKAKASGVYSGISLAARLMRQLGLSVEEHASEGVALTAGSPLLTALGKADQLHAVYKSAQLIMEYCSGISTRTHQMVEAVHSANLQCQVALTRKHFPGTKTLSFYAALAGGGVIHRTGLSESILVFDQHRLFLDDPVNAIHRAKEKSPERRIAVEVDTPKEGLLFAQAGADIIQCERFSPDVLKNFVKTLHREASGVRILAAGGVRGENAYQYAATGVDVLVTSWPLFAPPQDVKMQFSRVD